MKTLYVVRHGKTGGNDQNIYQAEDTPLSQEGRDQARILYERFTNIPLEVIYTSPLLRATETTEIINEELQLPVETDNLLKEWRKPASLIGKFFTDRKAQEFEKARILNRDNAQWKWKDEESVSEAEDRIAEFLLKMKTVSQEHILVSTHSFPMRMMLCVVLLEGQEINSYNRILGNISIKNTGITVFRLWDNKENWQLKTWNDHAHVT